MALLEADEVSVRFGGIAALTDAYIKVESGAITSLIGPNGAGKTTFFNALSGLNAPQSGHIIFDGTDVSTAAAFQRARMGMARTFQRLEVFGSLTAFENILVAAEIRKQWARDGDADPRKEADELVDFVGLRHLAGERVDAIPTGFARLVELGRAVAAKPKLLLLDEPSSGLDESETEFFGDLLLAITERGPGILLVEHDVDLVMRVSTDIHVLEFGQVIAVGTPKEIQRNKKVRAAYLGEEGAA